MTSRERMKLTLEHKSVDRPAVQYYYSPVGFYEHGEKLNDLYELYPGDFEKFTRKPVPVLPKEDFDQDGRYHVFRTNEWGVTYEYRVYGMMGHAMEFPVKSVSELADYQFPPSPHYTYDENGFLNLKNHFTNFKKDYFALSGCGASYLENVSPLRGFDNFMMDLYDDSEEINVFLDRITDYYLKNILALIKAGAEGIAFGDDFGTQYDLLLSKDLFRHALKPRFKRLMDPIREAGLHIHFHSCGRVIELFDDLRDLGVNSIWPQMPAYDMRELRDACKEYNFSIALHPDRAVTMTHGTPDDVQELIGTINEVFKPKDGGAWFYVEADTGFPFENIKALVESVNNF